jgi:hypothetical protein
MTQSGVIRIEKAGRASPSPHTRTPLGPAYPSYGYYAYPPVYGYDGYPAYGYYGGYPY